MSPGKPIAPLSALVPFVLVSTLLADDVRVDDTTIRAAAERGLDLVRAAALRYPEHRRCFSCHHQTLPLLAAVEARRAGLDVENGFDEAVLAFSTKSLAKNRAKMERGGHIGGRAATAAYALWTYEVADAEPGPLQAALVEYLLRTQREDGSWSPPSKGRPPLAESHVTLAVLAALGFERFATDEQGERVRKSRERLLEYLATVEPRTNEDRAFLLWGRAALDSDPIAVEEARAKLVATQRDDGGFAQTDELESDAYSTGQAIAALRYAGAKRTDPVLLDAAAFLLRTREPDGSWHVTSRAKPVQVYFDNGDPHGKDQFISTPATAWAVVGLSTLLPPLESEPQDASSTTATAPD